MARWGRAAAPAVLQRGEDVIFVAALRHRVPPPVIASAGCGRLCDLREAGAKRLAGALQHITHLLRLGLW